MVNFYVYAKDFSFHYHTNGLKTIQEFKQEVEKIENEHSTAEKTPAESKIIYLHWGHDCYEVDEATTIETFKNQVCDHFHTRPDSIISWLQEHYDINGENNKIRLLYIIIDGLIDLSCVEKCFRLIKDMHYENVILHAFSTNPHKVDLSVGTSFSKSRCNVYHNNQLYESTDIYKPFEYDKINVNNFVTEKESLKSYIRLKYIKCLKNDAEALQEINKLKKFRDRLFSELTEIISINLDTKDRNIFLQRFFNTEWYKNLTSSNYNTKVDIVKSISTLINYIVSDTKSYSFDALKFDTNFHKPIPEEEIVDVNFTTEQEIEFPDIILSDDKGIPVIILTTCDLLDKIIFHNTQSLEEVSPASFSKFKSTMQCPLFLMKDQYISDSIGYFYTLNVYKQFLTNNINTEPRTRRPFHGGLVLTDTNEFDKYNDYILSATYFNCKKVNYNVGLFYFVLYKNCENKEWMDRNVVEVFKNYTMRRISETISKIGLSSLPLDPQENTSLLTALWYCVDLSSCIFKHDSKNYMQERLRMYHGVAGHMTEILKHFDYDLNLESIEKRRELISYVSVLKKIQKREDKYYYLLERIFKAVDGFLVNEIDKPFNVYKLNYLKFNHKELLDDDLVDEIVDLNEYIHLMHIQGDLEASKAGKNTFEICKKTFRPFFAIEQNKSYYTEFVKSTRKVVIFNDQDNGNIKVTFENIDSLEFDRILSRYNLFIRCVWDLKKYPTLPEYAEYVMKKKKFNNQLVTIFPSNVYFDLKNVYEQYQKIVNKVEVEEFIKVCKSYVNRNERIKAEERVKFSSDDEIKEFLTKEELKVNLKKP